MNTPIIRRIFMPKYGFILAAYLALVSVAVPIWATTVIPPQFSELVNESDYIVRASVKSVTSEWRVSKGQRQIFTKVELEVLEVINGTPPQPLVLQMLGGRVGDEEMIIGGAPRFQVGQEDILFIRGNGRQFYPLTAAMHGRYPIQHDKGGRVYVARSNRVPLQDTSEVTLPMAEGNAAKIQQSMSSTTTALTPVQFAQQIRAAVNVNHTRTH